MTYRISTIGIDGAGKSTAVSELVSRLSPDFSVAKVGRPIYVERGGERKYIYGEVVGFLDGLHSAMDGTSSKKGVLVANSINVVIQPTLEKKIIEEHSPDIIIASRDMSICPAVYITYYLKSSQKISSELRLKIFNSFRKLGYPDQIFYLDINPETANERISSRIEKEQEGEKTDRPKWRHMHENEKNLSELRKYYLEAVEILRREGFEIIDIPTDYLNREAVAEKMESLIRKHIGPMAVAC